MPDDLLEDTMASLGDDLLDELDQIARAAHEKFRSYDPAVIVELDSSAQATCTYSHMRAEADKRFLGRDGLRPIDIRGLKLWLCEKANVVIRLKKMDEDGCTRNYPTKQARDFDRGFDLPGLPMPPVRLTAGYLLDPTRNDICPHANCKAGGAKENYVVCRRSASGRTARRRARLEGRYASRLPVNKCENQTCRISTIT